MKQYVYDVRNVCTLRELLETSVDEYGSNTAFVVKDKAGFIKEITYREFFGEVKALAAYLCSKGLEYKNE